MAGINCQQKLHVLAGLQQPQWTQNPDTCTPAVPSNQQWAQASHTCTHGCFSPFIPPRIERGANTYIFIVYLKYPGLRALSTPSRHLRGRQWETIPLSLKEERDSPFLLRLCCKIHLQFGLSLPSSWVSLHYTFNAKMKNWSNCWNLLYTTSVYAGMYFGEARGITLSLSWSCCFLLTITPHFPLISYAPSPLNTIQLDRRQSNINSDSLLTPVFHKPWCKS